MFQALQLLNASPSQPTIHELTTGVGSKQNEI